MREEVEAGIELGPRGSIAKLAGALTNLRINELVSDIAGASHEQAAGIGQVNTALTQMDHVTQQNAALVEQAAAAAASLEAQAQRLQSVVSAFRLPVQVPAAGQAYAALAA